ncbi:hypothetical protein LOTGIDRAFT_171035 [Lottia gigantea]|uniref:Uncharacterized protein n=1 Tax=Lottia gigantea TaxID=225164 RepID=V4B9Q2_LOTGI|nr:hypothetical protein LOTGIDRAFT_171035 [Lottia gigantea]ESP04196.1 hypothetical protein LOTGIDRAFT_171035 [Lottia gigantea]
MPPIRVTFTIPTGEEKTYTVPYKPLSPTVVTQNFILDGDKKVRKSLGNRHVSFKTVPSMLIPRVRVREDNDFMDLSDLVIPDDDLKAIHLAALYPSILNHQSKTRGDSVRGRRLGGRRVTFSDIICVCGSDSETESIWSLSSSGFGSSCSPPPYLESFGSTLPDITVTQKRLSSAYLGSDDHQHHGRRCSLCHELEDPRQRVVKYFGSVNQFLNWIFSKWGKGFNPQS